MYTLLLSARDRSRRRTAKFCPWFWCLANGPCGETGVSCLRETQAAIPRRGFQRAQPSELWCNQCRELLFSLCPSRVCLWSSFRYACRRSGRLEPSLPDGWAAINAVCAEIDVLIGRDGHTRNHVPIAIFLKRMTCGP